MINARDAGSALLLSLYKVRNEGLLLLYSLAFDWCGGETTRAHDVFTFISVFYHFEAQTPDTSVLTRAFSFYLFNFFYRFTQRKCKTTADLRPMWVFETA